MCTYVYLRTWYMCMHGYIELRSMNSQLNQMRMQECNSYNHIVCSLNKTNTCSVSMHKERKRPQCIFTLPSFVVRLHALGRSVSHSLTHFSSSFHMQARLKVVFVLVHKVLKWARDNSSIQPTEQSENMRYSCCGNYRISRIAVGVYLLFHLCIATNTQRQCRSHSHSSSSTQPKKLHT